MDVETQPWSEETRQRFAAAVGTLAEAVRRHGAAVLGATGRRAEVPGLFTPGDDLARAASAYTAAQLDFTGTTPKFSVDEPWDDDDEDEDAVADVTGLNRALYQIEHAGGVAALDDVPGLEETSSSTWILDPADDTGRQAALTAALIEDGSHEWGDDPGSGPGR